MALSIENTRDARIKRLCSASPAYYQTRNRYPGPTLIFLWSVNNSNIGAQFSVFSPSQRFIFVFSLLHRERTTDQLAAVGRPIPAVAINVLSSLIRINRRQEYLRIWTTVTHTYRAEFIMARPKSPVPTFLAPFRRQAYQSWYLDGCTLVQFTELMDILFEELEKVTFVRISAR